jgi:death-on-curing protein
VLPDPLSVADALAVHDAILAAYGGGAGLIDEAKLEAAMMRPRMAAHYGAADVHHQAAVLIAGVALAHAFVDGNERTATMLGLLLLRRQGIAIREEPVALSDLVVALVVAGDHHAATRDLEIWLRTHTEC